MPSNSDVLPFHQALLASIHGDVHAIAIDGPEGSLEIGRLGPLPVWSLAGSAGDARRLATWLARRGLLGLLIADHPDTHRRTLAVSVRPLRLAVTASSEPDPLVIQRLRRIATTAHGSLGLAMQVADALDIDVAGRRAFRSLHSALSSIVSRLDGRIPATSRHAWALLQLIRMLFLRFVEAEGWLDGRTDFLRAATDEVLARRLDPHRALLAPLFFGTLNRPPDTRSRKARSFGTVPYLNGGLFEAHDLERRHDWRLDPEGWRVLFDAILSGLEVTLDPGDVGDRVNPELLGRVFEGVMFPDARRAAGAFYTPPRLVEAMLRDAFVELLTIRFSDTPDVIRDRFERNDPSLDPALRTLRILDPAAGSGAFLVGAVQLLAGPNASIARVRHAVSRQVFGVDRNPAAIRIAELRLWLEVLRSVRGVSIRALRPLPNLDGHLRAGDSLLDPLAGARVPARTAAEVARWRATAARTHGRSRRQAMLQLRRSESAAMALVLEGRIERLEAAAHELICFGRETTLFGERGGLRHRDRRRLSLLRRELGAARAEHRRVSREESAPGFAIEAAFAPELRRGGFDLVVGNPPWVRAERLPAADRVALQSRFKWWRASGHPWRHLPDLSVAFLERSLELLAPEGTLAFLVPAKLATAGYARSLREAMARDTTLHAVADLGSDPRADFHATIYPLALVASRRRAEPGHRVRTSLSAEAARVPQVDWQGAETWGVARRAPSRHPSLAERFTIALGVKTGANLVFLDPPPALRRWTRPVIRGRDLRATEAGVDRRILWPADARGNPWPHLPAEVLAYLEPHRRRLEARTDLQRGPWWQLFRTAAATARWRVIWADIATDLHAVAVEDPEPVPLNSCYVIATRGHDAACRLAAWLSATPIREMASSLTEPASGGYRRFGARAVGSVPLPPEIIADASWGAIAASAPGAARQREIDARAAAMLAEARPNEGERAVVANRC